eukprot:TRINITY_DN1201_c0_g1_i2.p1 TRINITY_DN1201_c0_g1~~TRINITY_DN1201_c0_g1_i2.p1  ORF type:complete len:771 (-),score=140.95 TRINITY_DN1201_c0_g1_i2:115-2427(-)
MNSVSNTEFVASYTQFLENHITADFWALDFPETTTATMETAGVESLWLQHVHYRQLCKLKPQQRPVLLSRWSWFGCHRYVIGYSGHLCASWPVLQALPAFTAAAANACYFFWAHDVGGFTDSTNDAELSVRWAQYSVFSPILRFNSARGPYDGRRPWLLPSHDAQCAVYDALSLRQLLGPYVHSLACAAHSRCEPMAFPMYYLNTDRDEAYNCPDQFYFGAQLIVAPFLKPVDPATRLARQVVWLPKGNWYHLLSGKLYSSGWHAIYGDINDIPVFACAGAIISLSPTPHQLEFVVFPGADNSYELYSDDGTHYLTRASQAYITSVQLRHSAFLAACTCDRVKLPHFRKCSLESRVTVHVPKQQQLLSLVFRAVEPPCSVSVEVRSSSRPRANSVGRGLFRSNTAPSALSRAAVRDPPEVQWSYNADTRSIIVEPFHVCARDQVVVTVCGAPPSEQPADMQQTYCNTCTCARACNGGHFSGGPREHPAVTELRRLLSHFDAPSGAKYATEAAVLAALQLPSPPSPSPSPPPSPPSPPHTPTPRSLPPSPLLAPTQCCEQQPLPLFPVSATSVGRSTSPRHRRASRGGSRPSSPVAASPATQPPLPDPVPVELTAAQAARVFAVLTAHDAPPLCELQLTALREVLCDCGAHVSESDAALPLDGDPSRHEHVTRLHAALWNRHGLGGARLLLPYRTALPQSKAFLWERPTPAARIRYQCGERPPVTLPEEEEAETPPEHPEPPQERAQLQPVLTVGAAEVAVAATRDGCNIT